MRWCDLDFVRYPAGGTGGLYKLRHALRAFFFMVIVLSGFAFGLSGNGIAGDPWVIGSLEDFDEFSGDLDYWFGYVRLGVDIDLSGRTYTTAVIAPDIDSSEWHFHGNVFSGVFDGNGYVIRNLTIDTGGAISYYLGLFGKIQGGNAEVRNLGLQNVVIRSGDGSEYFGGLCGMNRDGNILNCYVSGSISSGDDSNYLGGLCGVNFGGSIINCYATGAVSGGGGDSGSFGGLCGFNFDGTIDKCYAMCSVSGGDDSYDIGGVCGNSNRMVSNCFWDVERSGIGSAGDDNDGATGMTTEEMQRGSTFSDAGWDFDLDGGADWKMLREGEDYPRLGWQEFYFGDIGGLYGVNFVDFGELSLYWGVNQRTEDGGQMTEVPLRCDLDGDGFVGVGDLVVLVGDWILGE